MSENDQEAVALGVLVWIVAFIAWLLSVGGPR